MSLHEYYLSIINLSLIAVVGALGLNILVGYTGQISVGHAAFMSVGAYTAANLAVHLHLPFWVTLPAGGLMAALIGAIVGIPSLQDQGPLSGHRHAGGPAHHRVDHQSHAGHLRRRAGLHRGAAARPSWGYQMKTQGQLYFFLLFFAALATLATLNLVRSRIGRAFVAIRDQDIAAEIIGINIFRYKLLSFAISSFYAGVCGVLYTYYFGIANYEAFQIGVSIDYLAMIIIGGLGSVLGSILGAIFVTMLPIVIRLVMEPLGRPVLQRRRAVEHHRQHQAGPVRRPDHLLSGGGAGGPQPVVAQHPQLLPRLAIFVLSMCSNEAQGGNAMSKSTSWLRSGHRGRRHGAGGRQPPSRRTRSWCSACNATAPAPRRPWAYSFAPAITTTSASLNSKGGVEGYKIRVIEIDHEYKVPPAMEAHERFKKEGAVLEGVYGTPQIAALTKKLEEDKILGTSPGFGNAASTDGKRYPYVFPIAASYWSQAAAAVTFAKKELGGSLKGKKIAYLFFDNPAGKDPLAILEDLAKIEGFELKTFAVPSPGVEMGAQVLDITGRYKPDFVIAHLFGRVAVGLHQGAQGQGLPAEQGDLARVGRLRGRHQGGRRV